MLRKELCDAIVARIRNDIPFVQAIYAYGSQVTGSTHAESDLDIALLLPPGKKVAPEILSRLMGDLEAEAGCTVEVSVLDLTYSVVHCKEVITTGRLLYVADPKYLAVFEMQTFSDYARLCEDRAVVVSAYTVPGP